MKKFALAAALGVSLAASSAHAQNLQPQMSAQDLTDQMEVEAGHVIVPILMMIFLILTAGGGNTVNTVAPV
jgi:Na+(H+)/acetate symporter ActP